MKKIVKGNVLKTLLIVLLPLLSVSPVFAGHDNHTFSGTAVVVNGTGKGKVYVSGGSNSTRPADDSDSWNATSSSDEFSCGSSENNDYVYFHAKPDDGSFLDGWYSDEACTNRVSGDLDYKHSTQSGSTTRYAKFMKISPLYYAAEAQINKGGSVKIAFAEGDLDSGTNPAAGHTESASVSSTSVTAYFKAIPDDQYVFVGWKLSPAGEIISESLTFSQSFDAISTEEMSPSLLTVYAYFAKESEYQAVVIDKNGSIRYQGSFSGALSSANTNETVRLLKSFDLSDEPITISKKITLDFNNYKISGSVSNLIVINSVPVTFVDNSERGNGGINVIGNSASTVNALNIASGSLTFHRGVISATNTSSTEGAKAVGVSVASGATLELNGGTIEANGTLIAEGVQVPSGATATLTTGLVDVQSADNAVGIVANGNTKVSWSVEINATTTATNAVGVLVDNASANTSIDGGIITAQAGTTDAYAIQVKQSIVSVSGNMAANATAGTASSAFAIKQEGSGIVNVETGRFSTNNSKEVTAAASANLKLYGGYYVHKTDLDTYKASADVTLGDLKSGTKFYTEGYRYVLSNGDNPNYVVASANGKKFSSLEDAIIYANNNPSTTMTIRLEVAEYTLPAGNYTIPAKATLLIPYMTNQNPQPTIERTFNKAYVKPSLFSKLVLESGVHIDLLGTIETGCKQSAQGQSDAANGAPTGPYGWIVLNANSEIAVADGGVIRAWGFITGAGTIDVRRGGKVREQFQILDFKGGTHTKNMSGGLSALMNGTAHNDGDVFPLTQYFIQNVECRTTYHPGAYLYCSTAWYMSMSLDANDIQLVGLRNKKSGAADDVAMFLMDDELDSEDTWVCKYYDSTTDRQVYEINNSASLGSFTITMSDYTFPTANFDLPITNNMTIRLRSGKLDMLQDIVLLAGAQIQIDKQSTFMVPAGLKLFLYDEDQWDTFVFSGFMAQRVKYIPSLNGAPTARAEGGSKTTKPHDASINVGGTMKISGAVYTTSGGANIYSSISDAGTIQIVDNPAPSETEKVCQWKGGTYVYQDCPSAMLKNDDGSFTETAGYDAGTTFCFIDMDKDGKGEWIHLEDDGCFVFDETHDVYYAKPQDYVPLFSEDEDETYHVYFSSDKSRAFILLEDNGQCQWWEIEPVEENDALVHCVHPDNDKYYYYDESDVDPLKHCWKEKRFTVTWVTKPYEELEENQGRVVYNVNYKSTPKYLGTNPSREMTDYYTYNFIGWLPEIVPVTDDAVYVAQFEQQDRKYMITFLDEDGSLLEEALWKMGEIPTPVNAPTPSGKKLVWEPTIQAVTGEATYRATYTDIILPSYEITFVNWNGAELQHGQVETGTVPVYFGATPTKPALADVAFEFEGWTPDLAVVDRDAIYTAKFREKPATYTITFKRAVGNEGVAIEPAETIQELELGYGETPVCTSTQLPTKTPTAAEYYTVIWSPLITAVTGNATYTATGFAAHKNTCRLTVSAGANGKVALDGSEDNLSKIYEYGDEATILATATTTGFHFSRWSDGNTVNPRTVTVNAAITLKAEFAVNQYEISWKNEDGSLIEKTIVNHGTMPSHVAPTKAATNEASYSFAGWTPDIETATANAAYTATFAETLKEYTIRIILDNGMSDIVRTYYYDDEVEIGTPVKASAGGIDYEFTHWTNSSNENIGTTIPNVTKNEVYTAHYDMRINTLVAGTSGDNEPDLSLEQPDMVANSLVIESTGRVNIVSGANLTVEDLILESNGTQSGQLLGNSASTGRLTVNGGAYFDLTLNTQHRTWYAVAVPWVVDAVEGISIKGGRQLVIGRDFDLTYYDGKVRAEQGKVYECWVYVNNEDRKNQYMYPGRLYMMYFGSNIETIRFKSANNVLVNSGENVTTHSSAETTDANWNGIANPAVYHAKLSAGNTPWGYVLNNGNMDEYLVGLGEPTYKTVQLSTYTAIVGKPFFIQAEAATPLTVNANIVVAAPRRTTEESVSDDIKATYEISFGKEGSTNKDNIFIQTAEEKEDTYVIGKDLTKSGINDRCAQIWVNQYDLRLAVNTTTAIQDVYNYPIELNIPIAGEYTIAIETQQGKADYLYLLKDGHVIWNLSNGAYTGTFEEGRDARYGLRASSQAQDIFESLDGIGSDEDNNVRKVIIENHVYIIRGNEVFTPQGQLITK